MAQLSTAVRNARLDVIESTIGTSPILKIYTGSAPANCAAAPAGTVVATLNLPSDWMGPASAGSKALSGTWQDAAADATALAGHYRIYDSSGIVCHMQGSVGLSGGGAELQVDNTSFVLGRQFTISSFNWSDPDA